MKCLIAILLLFFIHSEVGAFSYDEKDLPKDLKSATDIVIAKKVSGIISYASLTDEINSFQRQPVNWRESPAWEKLQKRNSIKSKFLVLSSIKGDFTIGDEFEYEDSWIPVELGSVKLYFLFRKNEQVESNPCHIINLLDSRNKIIQLSNSEEKLIDFVLKNKLSFCANKNGN